MTWALDDELTWLWCGTEATAKLVGPFADEEAAEVNRQRAAELGACSCDHISMRASARQIARSLPADTWLLSYSLRTQSGRILIGAPYEWNAMEMLQLMEQEVRDRCVV